jgi:hypothetical protein
VTNFSANSGAGSLQRMESLRLPISSVQNVIIIIADICLSRWWFASTAFPLIAGTFGPMASAFSICALAVHWRVEIPPGAAEQNGIELPDPKW